MLLCMSPEAIGSKGSKWWRDIFFFSEKSNVGFKKKNTFQNISLGR